MPAQRGLPVAADRPGPQRRSLAVPPGSHKTEHHDRERVIFIGPKAQEVILPYLLRDAAAYCFSPAESMKEMRDSRRTARKTPIHYGNRPGTNRKIRPQRTPRLRYAKDSYARAIRRGVDKANKAILEEAQKAGVENPPLLVYWAPNQLRHAAGTTVPPSVRPGGRPVRPRPRQSRRDSSVCRAGSGPGRGGDGQDRVTRARVPLGNREGLGIITYTAASGIRPRRGPDRPGPRNRRRAPGVRRS